MKKILILISLLSFSLVNAEWVLFNSYSNGDKYWYENDRVKIINGNTFVWVKVKNGSSLVQGHLKIDCADYTHQIISNSGRRELLSAEETIEILSKILCGGESLHKLKKEKSTTAKKEKSYDSKQIKHYLSIEEVSLKLGLTNERIINLCLKDMFPCEKINGVLKIHEEKLNKFLQVGN